MYINIAKLVKAVIANESKIVAKVAKKVEKKIIKETKTANIVKASKATTKVIKDEKNILKPLSKKIIKATPYAKKTVDILKVVKSAVESEKVLVEKVAKTVFDNRGKIISKLLDEPAPGNYTKSGGWLMANNLRKSFVSARKKALDLDQDTTKIDEALRELDIFENKHGKSELGNYVYFLYKMEYIDEIILDELFGSDSEIVGRVLVNSKFLEYLRDEEIYKEFKRKVTIKDE